MKKLTAVIPYHPHPAFFRTLHHFVQSPRVEKVIILGGRSSPGSHPKCEWLRTGLLTSGRTLNALVKNAGTPYLLFFVRSDAEIQPGPGSLERMLDAAGTTAAGMVYSDYCEAGMPEQGGRLIGRRAHPLNDCQPGSIRDAFDFGALMLCSRRAMQSALRRHGEIPDVKWAGLYDLRLKISMDHELLHLREFLYTLIEEDGTAGGEALFDYLDPRNRAAQKEMEAVATRHLKRVGAWLKPGFEKVPQPAGVFPVEASVVIPVRNRRRTIGDAVESALSQRTDFSFNVLVVDNHSTDGTTALLSRLAKQRPALKHLIPSRRDLSIGGCWNEAVYSEACGRYAVQLDSDDLYSGTGTLRKIVDRFRSGGYAMVIGSYSIVNERLKEIPPGLIDHREWTDRNGRNNALRINGLGAPRAFDTALLRRVGGFLNVGYGEDYAIALRLSREYRIGRIYENLYLCRRWKGNTDAALSIEDTNRNDAFKDRIRTIEIMARQKLNREAKSRQ